MEKLRLATDPDSYSIQTQKQPEQNDQESDCRQWELLASRLGARYAACRLSNYECDSEHQEGIKRLVRDYLCDLTERCKAGQSVVLMGPPGTGKDHLMVAMMRAAVHMGFSLKWQDGAEMFGGFRDAMKGTATEEVLLDRYTRPTVLAISDPVPPFGGLTPYQSGMFFRIIDRRYRDMKPTWITINAKDRKEAEDRMGANIVDRLGHDALALPCQWESFRKRGN